MYLLLGGSIWIKYPRLFLLSGLFFISKLSAQNWHTRYEFPPHPSSKPPLGYYHSTLPPIVEICPKRINHTHILTYTIHPHTTQLFPKIISRKKWIVWLFLEIIRLVPPLPSPPSYPLFNSLYPNVQHEHLMHHLTFALILATSFPTRIGLNVFPSLSLSFRPYAPHPSPPSYALC